MNGLERVEDIELLRDRDILREREYQLRRKSEIPYTIILYIDLLFFGYFLIFVIYVHDLALVWYFIISIPGSASPALLVLFKNHILLLFSLFVQ